MSQNNITSDLHKEAMHLALSPWDLTDDYNRHACVTLLSFLNHCSKPVVVHILYDHALTLGKEQETAHTKQCYQEIIDRFGAQIVYHHVALPEWISSLPSMKIWTPGAIMRLYLPELLSSDIEKVIYLDCDMVVLTDIDILWGLDIDTYCLAACNDAWAGERFKHKSRYLKKHQISRDSYFNSGMLVLNLKKMREDSFTGHALEYLRNNPDLKYPDQDLLNRYCHGNYLPLDGKYNVFSWVDDAMKYTDDGIIHYTIGKPWKAYYGEIDDFYWRYLVQTPWVHDDIDKFRYVRAAPDIARAVDLVSHHLLSVTSGAKVEKVRRQLKIVFSILMSMVHEFGKSIRR